MVEPDNLMLEHLRAIRGEMAKLPNWMETMSTEMITMRHHLLGTITTQNHLNIGIVEARKVPNELFRSEDSKKET